MSNSINTIIICGNVTRDAEIRTLNDNETKVATFTVATSEGGYKTRDGRDVPEVTQFHRVVAWRGLAELANQAIKKGVLVVVEGKMTYRSYDDDKGVRHDFAEIQANNIKIASSGNNAAPQSSTPVATQSSPTMEQPNDDIPF